MIPISKNIIEPEIKTNIEYVNCIEDFEKIELEPNETILRFDNNQMCFYLRERDKFGEYAATKIFFYENFAQRVQSIEKAEFEQKCIKVGLDELKVKIAVLFFLENKKPYDVWEWLLQNTDKGWEWDTVKNLKYRLKKKLFPELIKKVCKK